MCRRDRTQPRPLFSPSLGVESELPGARLLAGRVWPAPKLPKGTTVLSPALIDMAGRPPLGSAVLIYKPSSVASSLSSSTCGEHSTVGQAGCSQLVQNGSDDRPTVVLELCGDTLWEPAFGQATAFSSGREQRTAAQSPDPRQGPPLAQTPGPAARASDASAQPSAQAAPGPPWPSELLQRAIASRDEGVRKALEVAARQHLLGR